MVRKGSTGQVRKGARWGRPSARSARRSSSVGKSTRLIIVGSRVRIPPPLPTPQNPDPQHPKAIQHGEREVRAHEAALEHWDDWSYRSWEDDADCCDHEG